MKYSEFIELYKAMDDQLLHTLEIRKYVPLQEKLAMAYSVVLGINSSIGDDIQSPAFVEVQEIMRFFAILKLYTNVEIEPEETTAENYDECQQLGVEQLILKRGSSFDIKRFEEILKQMTSVNDTLLLRQVLLNQDISKLNDGGKEMISELKENSEVIESLFKLFTPMNKSEK